MMCGRAAHDVVTGMIEPTTRAPEAAGHLSSEAAAALAKRLLGESRTGLGGLCIAHARRVAARVRTSGDDRTVAVALLHDVVETGSSSAPTSPTGSWRTTGT
jgi:(p)ppGpp synthase/HD superfamily hydrolase